MSESISIFWHRRDLRISDNAGLFKALNGSNPVRPLFIFDTSILDELDDKEDARVTFIHKNLAKLKSDYRESGGDLMIRIGKPMEVWKKLVDEFSIDTVYTNRDYEPYARQRDQDLAEFFRDREVKFVGAKDQVILEKSEVVKDDGDPYTVFTPYSKKWRSTLKAKDLEAFDVEGHLGQLDSFEANSLPSLKEIGFSESSVDFPSADFPMEIIEDYENTRDIPSKRGTSRLSVHLRFGTISIRELYRAVQDVNPKYATELIWREFYQMVLYHFPHSVDKAIKPAYDRIEWEHDDVLFQKWCDGKTGYPLVDAGMRELNQTGYMHNRVRMVVASFLTKHLLMDWRLGERYFAQKLLDYELASNVGGWQWASGSGCDAAPYFRIFNPHSQKEKFDPDEKYIKKWVPEYGTDDYPEPIVEHKWARERALSRYKEALKTN